MPHFFFHVHDGTDRPDRTGVDLPDRFAAWDQATKACGEMVRELDGNLLPGELWRMEVVEGADQLCWRFEFKAESFVDWPRPSKS